MLPKKIDPNKKIDASKETDANEANICQRSKWMLTTQVDATIKLMLIKQIKENKVMLRMQMEANKANYANKANL